jgi:hypothetical protein
MVDGLVITRDKAIFEEFNINFSSERNHLEYADSPESAQEILKLEIPDYLVIMENSVKKVQEFLNLLYSNEEIKKIPVICFLSLSAWSGRDILWQIGVKDIIQLPISKEELELQFERFIFDISEESFDQEDAGMHGKLEDYNLLDLIQTLDANKKTGVLVLYRSREEGKIWFDNGNIHDAKYRTFQPLQAILKMITWSDGDFSIAFIDEKYEKLIEEDNQKILLDSLQYIDRRNKILDQLADLHELFLISPEADMEKMNENEVNFLRFFHGGQTIASYLDAFDMNDLSLLALLQGFREKELLMTRDEFDSHRTEQELEAEEAGIKSVFKKFFKRKEEEAVKKDSGNKKVKTVDAKDTSFTELELHRYDNLFQKESIKLDKIKEKIEKI